MARQVLKRFHSEGTFFENKGTMALTKGQERRSPPNELTKDNNKALIGTKKETLCKHVGV